MTREEIERCDALWCDLFAAGRTPWRPGMLVVCPGWPPLRLCWSQMPFVWGGIGGEVTGHNYCHILSSDVVPDWTDPATLGCLLALVREQCPDATTQIEGDAWWVAARNGTRLGGAGSEAGAMLAALAAVKEK